MAEISDHLARRLAQRAADLQAEVNRQGYGDPRDAELARLRTQLDAVKAIVGQGIPDGAAAQWSAWYRLMEILDVDPFTNMPPPPEGWQRRE